MPVKRQCHFCLKRMNYIDYKNVTLLRAFSNNVKIKARYYSGACLNHQKKLANAIKNARLIGFLPFVK